MLHRPHRGAIISRYLFPCKHPSYTHTSSPDRVIDHWRSQRQDPNLCSLSVSRVYCNPSTQPVWTETNTQLVRAPYCNINIKMFSTTLEEEAIVSLWLSCITNLLFVESTMLSVLISLAPGTWKSWLRPCFGSTKVCLDSINSGHQLN